MSDRMNYAGAAGGRILQAYDGNAIADPRLEECDCCHEIIPVREAIFNGIQTLCKECADKITA